MLIKSKLRLHVNCIIVIIMISHNIYVQGSIFSGLSEDDVQVIRVKSGIIPFLSLLMNLFFFLPEKHNWSCQWEFLFHICACWIGILFSPGHTPDLIGHRELFLSSIVISRVFCMFVFNQLSSPFPLSQFHEIIAWIAFLLF